MTEVVNKDDCYQHNYYENKVSYARIAGSFSRHHFYTGIPVIRILKLKM